MSKIILVMIGGSVGALCRYGMGLLSARLFGGSFPWGTLLVNLVGCFLIGVSFALADRTMVLSPATRLFFMTGFLGALTTFSTFALETIHAVRTGTNFIAILNFFANNIAGLALVLVGMWLAEVILRGE